MVGFLTDLANVGILNMVLGGIPFPSPSVYYFGLGLGLADKGGGYAEASGGSYSRVAITNNTTNFPNAVSGSKTGAFSVTFPQPTGDWGMVQSVLVFGSPAGNDLYAVVQLDNAFHITGTSSPPSIPLNSFSISHT